MLPENNGDPCGPLYPNNPLDTNNTCNSSGFEPDLVNNVYAINNMTSFDDEISWAIANQFDSYRHLREGPNPSPIYWKPLEMRNYADTDLRVDYMFWTYANNTWPQFSIDAGYGTGYQVIAGNQMLGDECF